MADDWWKEFEEKNQSTTPSEGGVTIAPPKSFALKTNEPEDPDKWWKRYELDRSGGPKPLSTMENIGAFAREYGGGHLGIGKVAPNMSAGLSAAFNPLTGIGSPGGSWSERYKKNLENMEAKSSQYRKENPKTAMGARMGGAVASSLPIASAASIPVAGSGLLANMGAQGAAFGTAGVADKLIENAVSGHDNSLGDLGWEGAKGGIGGMVGPLASKIFSPSAYRAAKPIPSPPEGTVSSVFDSLDKSIPGTPQFDKFAPIPGTSEAGGVIKKALDRISAGTSPEDIKAILREMSDTAEKKTLERGAKEAAKAHIFAGLTGASGLAGGAFGLMHGGPEQGVIGLLAGGMLPPVIRAAPHAKAWYLKHPSSINTRDILTAMGGATGVQQ